MSEMSTLKGITCAVWQSFKMWEEHGRPHDWLILEEVKEKCHKHRKQFERKWS